jgi:feruloyl-CoA synthase
MAARLHSNLRYAPGEVTVEKRADGGLVLRSPQPLRPYPRCVGDWLKEWYEKAPDRTFLAERNKEGGWRRLTYRDALSDTRRIGQALLNLGLNAERPVAILSENSIDFALLALGAMHVGVPVAPVSTAYSLMSKDFAKLKYIFDLVRPGLVFAADPQKYGLALAAVGAKSTPVAELLETNPGSTLEVAHSRVTPDTVAKILFTSGSTGIPKGVINTQRMLTSNQQSWAQVWPFLEDNPPAICEWLPWNHTFGGNATFGLILRNGGTFYIDGGRPVPGLFETTLRNLREVPTTLHFNVPRAYDLLVPQLESDAQLRATFFRDLKMLFYAGAALPQNLWERLERLALQEKGGELAMTSSWGSTETAPMALSVYAPADRAGVIGLPGPGCEIKLVPSGSKLEARVKGPNVTPGYFRSPELTRAAFDDDGYYCIGDALKLVDPAAPEKGLVFDGRVAEDFKLTTGTWVHVGALRIKLIAACNPLLMDAVITGHDRDEVGALVFLSPVVSKDKSPEEIQKTISDALALLAREGGSSTHPKRVLVLAEPPSIDAGEITDKGYINQRAVLERRAALVEKLYASPAPAEVIT